jgi:hypothetical protein
MIAVMTFTPRPVDPGQVRPRRIWYAVAAVFAGVGIAGGVVFAVLAGAGLNAVAKGLPAITDTFDSSTPKTVELTADKHWAVYVVGSPDTDRPAVTCSGKAVELGSIDLSPVSYTFRMTESGDTWYQEYEVTVTQDGSYQLTCALDGKPDAPARFGVGESANIGRFVGGMFGGIGAIFAALGTPCVGVVIAVVIVLVTALRRNAHRKRLQVFGA